MISIAITTRSSPETRRRSIERRSRSTSRTEAYTSATCLDPRTTIRIERVVRGELFRNVIVVVVRYRLESRRERVQAGRLRGQLSRVRVGAAHDQRQRAERRIFEIVFPQKRIERALGAVMAELDARNVIWDRGLTRRDLLDLIRRYIQKRRLLVDKPTDQPRTCDP